MPNITTAHSRPTNAKNQPPDVTHLVRRDEEVDHATATLYRFVTTASRNHLWKIVKFSNDTPEMQAIVDQAVHDLNSIYVKFNDWAFVTASPAVAALLMRRQREGNIEIYQDQESLVFQCPNCAEKFPNSSSGRESFGHHLLENHLDLTIPAVPLPIQEEAVA